MYRGHLGEHLEAIGIELIESYDPPYGANATVSTNHNEISEVCQERLILLVRTDPKPNNDVILEQSNNAIGTANARGEYSSVACTHLKCRLGWYELAANKRYAARE